MLRAALRHVQDNQLICNPFHDSLTASTTRSQESFVHFGALIPNWLTLSIGTSKAGMEGLSTLNLTTRFGAG